MNKNNKKRLQQKHKQSDAQAEAEAAAKAQADADGKRRSSQQKHKQTDAKNAEEKIENMMNTCGDGTVYENGECVLSPMEKNASDFKLDPNLFYRNWNVTWNCDYDDLMGYW